MPQSPSSTLMDEILEVQEAGRAPGCTIRTILAALADQDRNALVSALETPAVTGAAIAAVLKRRGFSITSHTVQRHRRKVCSCE